MSGQLRGLYAITDSMLLAGGKLIPWVDAALAGGARIVQYRDKSGDSMRRLDEARELNQLCQHYGATLIINDDLPLATELGVGLHLGREDGCLRTAREQLGPHAIIGATCHADLNFAAEAEAAGANYIAFGRFFQSITKPATPQATPVLLEQARQRFKLPVVAIGGITLNNAPQLIGAGASMLAMINGLFAASSANEVEHRARSFTELFQSN